MKVIVIGECALDITFPVNTTLPTQCLQALPGGRLLNAAALLGRKPQHYDVSYMGEVARDSVGDTLTAFLERNGVSVKSVDRYVDGVTPTNLYFPTGREGEEPSVVCFRKFPAERFDAIWPRIDAGDIVVFGSYFALEARVRPQLQEILNHAVDRKATIVYLPGFLPQQAMGITKIMPAIHENLEVSDIVLSRTTDMVTIFKESDATRCYERHIQFYCKDFINIDSQSQVINWYHNNNLVSVPITTEGSTTLMWHAGALAGLVETMITMDINRSLLAVLNNITIGMLIDGMLKEANAASSNTMCYEL